MKIRSTAKRTAESKTVVAYVKAQKPALATICRLLRKEIDATLPMAGAKIYHAIPVWFIAGNPVVGFSVNAQKKVNLLFWNGQAFKEPDLIDILLNNAIIDVLPPTGAHPCHARRVLPN